jgi:hypothetical protein
MLERWVDERIDGWVDWSRYGVREEATKRREVEKGRTEYDGEHQSGSE